MKKPTVLENSHFYPKLVPDKNVKKPNFTQKSQHFLKIATFIRNLSPFCVKRAKFHTNQGKFMYIVQLQSVLTKLLKSHISPKNASFTYEKALFIPGFYEDRRILSNFGDTWMCCSSEAYFWPNIWFDFRFHIPVQGVSLNLKLWPCSWILGFSLPSWSNVVLAISSNVNIVFNVPHKTYSCATIIIIKATFH